MNRHRRMEAKRARRAAGRRNPPDVILTTAQKTTRDLITYQLHAGRLAMQFRRANPGGAEE
jgi:hypothetical protein